MLERQSCGNTSPTHWQHVGGRSFERNRWLLAFFILLLPAWLFFFPIGLLCVGLSTVGFWTGDLAVGFGVSIFGLISLGLSYTGFWQTRYYWKCRKSPLAVITTDGIYLPFNRPEYVSWSDVDAVNAFYMKGTAFLDLRVREPVHIFGKRRGWWHGPWRDRVILRIGSSSNPLLQAARDAHNLWVDRLGT